MRDKWSFATALIFAVAKCKKDRDAKRGGRDGIGKWQFEQCWKENRKVNFRKCQGTFTFVSRQGSSATCRISLRSVLSRSALASKWHRFNRCLSYESTDTTTRHICTRIVCESLNRILLAIHSSNIDNRVWETKMNANVIRELWK